MNSFTLRVLPNYCQSALAATSSVLSLSNDTAHPFQYSNAVSVCVFSQVHLYVPSSENATTRHAILCLSSKREIVFVVE